MKRFTTCAMALALAGSTAVGQVIIPSDGSDGAFAPTASVTIDLSLALSGPTVDWTTPGIGNGVYDPDQWAIVFKYASVNIPTGVDVTFTNHPSRAPVIWLVQGDVNIDGRVIVDGSRGHAFNAVYLPAEPGPGGFRGGRGQGVASTSSGGFGPGGPSIANSDKGGSGGSYGSGGSVTPGATGGALYGSPGVFPLIGGSGGAGGRRCGVTSGGGGGGGAILIASATNIVLNGSTHASGGGGGTLTCACGGGGGGAGGGIRLVADVISGTGFLTATGGAPHTVGGNCNHAFGAHGGVGRIRLEANTLTLADVGNPVASNGFPGVNPVLFRDTTTPTIRSVMLAAQSIPADPHGSFVLGQHDVSVTDSGLTQLVITAENVPINTPLDTSVVVRMVPASGQVTTVNAVYQSGTTASSTWTADVNLANGFAAFDVRAILP